MPKTYWEHKGRYQVEYELLQGKLVPDQGEAPTEHGELLRCLSNIYYDCYNNGACNMGVKSDEVTTLRHAVASGQIPFKGRGSNDAKHNAIALLDFLKAHGESDVMYPDELDEHLPTLEKLADAVIKYAHDEYPYVAVYAGEYSEESGDEWYEVRRYYNGEEISGQDMDDDSDQFSLPCGAIQAAGEDFINQTGGCDLVKVTVHGSKYPDGTKVPDGGVIWDSRIDFDFRKVIKQMMHPRQSVNTMYVVATPRKDGEFPTPEKWLGDGFCPSGIFMEESDAESFRSDRETEAGYPYAVYEVEVSMVRRVMSMHFVVGPSRRGKAEGDTLYQLCQRIDQKGSADDAYMEDRYNELLSGTEDEVKAEAERLKLNYADLPQV